MSELGIVAAVAMVTLAVASAGVAAEDLGARLYAERCTACHGPEGRGDGPVAAALEPPPRNFRDEEFWKARTLDDIRKVVREGRPGTLMQAFGGVFSDAEIDAVARYVASFRPTEAVDDATGRDGEASGARPREDATGRPDRR
jgi:mono/diheme cytochrome c family protein